MMKFENCSLFRALELLMQVVKSQNGVYDSTDRLLIECQEDSGISIEIDYTDAEHRLVKVSKPQSQSVREWHDAGICYDEIANFMFEDNFRWSYYKDVLDYVFASYALSGLDVFIKPGGRHSAKVHTTLTDRYSDYDPRADDEYHAEVHFTCDLDDCEDMPQRIREYVGKKAGMVRDGNIRIIG